MSKYTVILEAQNEGGFTAQCLEIPSAISQGETKEEALRNVEEAIRLVQEEMISEISKHKDIRLITVDVPV